MLIIRNLIYIVFTISGILLNHHQSKCQTIGSTGESLGGISTLISDPFSVFNNPALIDNDLSDVGVNISVPYGIYEFKTSSFGIRKNLGIASMGLGLSNSSIAGMDIQDLFIAFGKKVENFQFGSSIQIKQINIDENGKHHSVLFNIGAISSVLPKIDFGVFISNINQAGMGITEKYVYESDIKLFTKIEASEKTYFLFEIDKDIYSNADYRIGLEYRITECFHLYTGLENGPIEPSAGFSLHWRKMQIASGFSIDQRLGISQSFNLCYEIQNKP